MSLFETWTKDVLERTISGISGATKIGVSAIADMAPGPLQTVLETIVNRIPPLDTTDTPSDGEVLTYDSSTGKYKPSASAQPLPDNTALVKNSTDATKRVRVDAANVATDTTRVLTMPNADVNLTADQAADTASLRTLGTGAAQAAPGSDARFNPPGGDPGQVLTKSSAADFVAAWTDVLPPPGGDPPGQSTESTAGIAEVATQTETNTGIDDARFVTPAKLSGRTATETRTGIVELATDTETQTGTDTTHAITPANLSTRTATETRSGIAEIASQTEVDTGVDDARIITPLKAANLPRLPTQNENDALQGTSGSPSTTNRYVTNADVRLRDYVNAKTEYGTTHTALISAATTAMTEGKKLVIPKANYNLAGSFLINNITTDLEVICEPGAVFTAQSGFPNVPMVRLIGGAGKVIKWTGGYFDASLVPNSGAGEHNDGVSFELTGARRLVLEHMEVRTGSDFLTSGSDSCMFAGWATHMSLYDITVSGARDAGIYLSGGSTGDGLSEISEELFFDAITATACSVGLIAKRRWRRLSGGKVQINDCPSGVVLGGEALLGNGTVDVLAQDITLDAVLARRAETALVLRFSDNATVGKVVSRNMGTYLTTGAGYTSTTAQAVSLQGAQRSVINAIIADRENTSIPSAVTSRAITTNSRTINSVTRHSTMNAVGPIISQTLDASVVESDVNQANNHYLIGAVNSTGGSTILGTGSGISAMT